MLPEALRGDLLLGEVLRGLCEGLFEGLFEGFFSAHASREYRPS